jgi:hypothetical protein
MPYPIVSVPTVVTRHNSSDPSWVPGKLYTGQKVVGESNQFTLDGDWRSKFIWIGERYNWWYRFSPQVPRRQSSNGALVPVTTAQLQLLKFKVHFTDTGYCELRVTPAFRDTAVYVYEGRRLDQSPPLLDQISYVTDEFGAVVGADSRQVTIEMFNDSHLPCWVAAAEWEGQLRYKSQRL